jgi:hypothetical protein
MACHAQAAATTTTIIDHNEKILHHNYWNRKKNANSTIAVYALCCWVTGLRQWSKPIRWPFPFLRVHHIFQQDQEQCCKKKSDGVLYHFTRGE